MKHFLEKNIVPFLFLLLAPSCAIKKSSPPTMKAQNEQTHNSVQQTAPPTDQSHVKEMTKLAQKPAQEKRLPLTPQPVEIGINTKEGYLGKKTRKEENASIIKFAQEFQKDPGHINSYHHFKFDVKNASGTTLYATCFAYIKPRRFNRWRWRKSSIFEIKAGGKVPLDIRVLNDHRDLNNIFGCLGVFSTKQEAEESTYELLPDTNKLDLDLLAAIQNKSVVVGIERYGLREPFYDFDFVDPQQKGTQDSRELDFFVQNQTGKPLFVTAFIYAKKAKGRWIAAEDDKDDMSVWRYYKTKVLRLNHDQTGYIEVDSIIPKRDRSFVRGYLGIFNEDQEDDAHRKTFELLAEKEKLNLGTLSMRRGRTIILEVERYGVANDIIDYRVKPIKWIDFSKIVR